MKAKELLIIGLTSVMILIGYGHTSAESQSNEGLQKFYQNYLSDKINKTQSKTYLINSKSENLRLVASMAEKEASFLALNRDELVGEMMKEDLGKKSYKIEHFLNGRFIDFHNCTLRAEASELPNAYACR